MKTIGKMYSSTWTGPKKNYHTRRELKQRKINGEQNLVIGNNKVIEKEDETAPKTEPATDRARCDRLTCSTKGNGGGGQ